MTTSVKAVLVSKVSFQNSNGQTVSLPSQTEIVIDPEHGIALAGSDYFDIDRSEYNVLYLN